MELLQILDLLSIFVFALVGARVAADKGLDYGGITLVAISFVLLIELGVTNSISALVGGVIVALTRFVSIYYDLHLPKFK